MNRIPLLLLILGIAIGGWTKKDDFRAQQKKYDRVGKAYKDKWSSIRTKLKQLGIDTTKTQLFIRGFKQDKKLEAWVRSGDSGTWKLYKTYDICSSSGELGPKRKEGDGQVPEGFYHVNIFNPFSNYHLSLGVSYPNASDKVLGTKGSLGGAIMIHGNCVTIGCIPITDDMIKELYVLAVEAKSCGQSEIPIHLFPTKLTDAGLKQISTGITDAKLTAFWKNLKEGYDYFETKKALPVVSVDKAGKYSFK